MYIPSKGFGVAVMVADPVLVQMIGELTDTVGFIDRLPIALIEAFHSTLEETIFSDLIILMLDFSEPIDKIEKKLNVCGALRPDGCGNCRVVLGRFGGLGAGFGAAFRHSGYGYSSCRWRPGSLPQ